MAVEQDQQERSGEIRAVCESAQQLRERYNAWCQENAEWLDFEAGMVIAISAERQYSDEEKAALAEGVRVVRFAIQLARETFPKATRGIDDPPIALMPVEYAGTYSDASNDWQPKLIGFNADFLRSYGTGGINSEGKLEFFDEMMAALIETTVEEFAHWVWLSKAWKGQPDRKREELAVAEEFEKEYQISQDKDRFWKMIVETIETIDYLPGLEEMAGLYYQINQTNKEMRRSYYNYHTSGLEYMAIIWQRVIGERFLLWSQTMEENKDEYEVTTAMKRVWAKTKRYNRGSGELKN